MAFSHHVYLEHKNTLATATQHSQRYLPSEVLYYAECTVSLKLDGSGCLPFFEKCYILFQIFLKP